VDCTYLGLAYSSLSAALAMFISHVQCKGSKEVKRASAARVSAYKTTRKTQFPATVELKSDGENTDSGADFSKHAVFQSIIVDASSWLPDLHCRRTTDVGATAALRDRSKYRLHVAHLHPGYTLEPAIVEWYAHLGNPIMWHIHTLRDIALARSLAVTQESCRASAHRELSVASFFQRPDYVYCPCGLLGTGAGSVAGKGTSFLDSEFSCLCSSYLLALPCSPVPR
jgi:hypothetical protein